MTVSRQAVKMYVRTHIEFSPVLNTITAHFVNAALAVVTLIFAVTSAGLDFNQVL